MMVFALPSFSKEEICNKINNSLRMEKETKVQIKRNIMYCYYIFPCFEGLQGGVS